MNLSITIVIMLLTIIKVIVIIIMRENFKTVKNSFLAGATKADEKLIFLL